jgi:hypothetical protein
MNFISYKKFFIIKRMIKNIQTTHFSQIKFFFGQISFFFIQKRKDKITKIKVNEKRKKLCIKKT